MKNELEHHILEGFKNLTTENQTVTPSALVLIDKFWHCEEEPHHRMSVLTMLPFILLSNIYGHIIEHNERRRVYSHLALMLQQTASRTFGVLSLLLCLWDLLSVTSTIESMLHIYMASQLVHSKLHVKL